MKKEENEMKRLWNCCCCCEELNNVKLIQKVDLHNKYMCLTC